jgi:L-aspartate semialdehyde sulfurtransferase ferredoxin
LKLGKGKYVTRIEERCTQCGACVVICPTGALSLNKNTRKIDFDSEKCIACELCVKPCPPRAMVVKF